MTTEQQYPLCETLAPNTMTPELETARRDYVSHEPPCGWLKLQSLFIQKSVYLIINVDWDSKTVNFEPLSQIIDYGKLALRECLERKHEADALKAQRDELLEALEFARKMMTANDLTPECMPHTFEVIDEAVAKAKGE